MCMHTQNTWNNHPKSASTWEDHTATGMLYIVDPSFQAGVETLGATTVQKPKMFCLS